MPNGDNKAEVGGCSSLDTIQRFSLLYDSKGPFGKTVE